MRESASDPAVSSPAGTAFTPARLAAIAVAAVGVGWLLLAFRVHGPVLMPDEYFYSAIARSIARGGLPTVRGGQVDLISMLAPIVSSPAWLIHNVASAYRVAQAEGVVLMTLAALPAHALSRRVGLSEPMAAAAAVFAVLIPDLVWSGRLLSEPLAYPLFLAAMVFAVDALERPTLHRQSLFLVAAGALCLTRLQFVFLPLAYLVAAVLSARPVRGSRALRSHRLVSGTIAGLAAAVVAVGTRSVAGRYSGLATFSHSPGALLHWSASNLVLLLVVAGWVTAPGAALGLAHQIRGREPAARAFGTLSVLVVAAVVIEAGIFGAGLGQMEERYTFYAAPLLVIACLFAAERGLLATRSHGMLAGVLIAVAILVPLDDPIFTGMRDHSPVLIAFGFVQRHAHWRAPIVAGALLGALSLAGLVVGRRGSGRHVIGLASALVVSIGVGYTVVFAPATRSQDQGVWRLEAPPRRASLLAFAGNTAPTDVSTALFWNPDIRRVLVLGGKTIDGFASVPVRLGPGGRLLTAAGPVRGPVVFLRRHNTIRTRGPSVTVHGSWALIDDASRTKVSELVIGWSRAAGTFEPNGRIAVAASDPRAWVRRTVRLWLRNPTHGFTRLRFDCSGGVRRLVSVGTHARTVSLPLVGRGVASCRFAIASGRIRWRDGDAETVQARVDLHGKRSAAGRGSAWHLDT